MQPTSEEIIEIIESSTDIDLLKNVAIKLINLVDLYEKKDKKAHELVEKMMVSLKNDIEIIRSLSNACIDNGIPLPARVTELLEQIKLTNNI
jgi:hypothetical protein